MSEILLYITLIVLAPAGVGEGYELSYKSSVEGAVFSFAQEELSFSQIITGSDGDVGLLSNELIATDFGRSGYANLVYQYQPFISLQQNKDLIRAPPAVS